MSRVHVVGAGMAGLSAAIALTRAGHPVTLIEAGPQAGGRCRSYDDREIGCRVDNGNHLLLSGNRAAMAYLDTIGARATLGGPGAPLFPFCDVRSGRRWTVRPNRSRIPWWVLSSSRRVPGTRARDYLALLPLARARGEATLAGLLPVGPLTELLMEPLAIAALNTPLANARATLMGRVMRETLLRGGNACIPLFPRENLAASLVDPALAWLRAHGAELRLACRVTALRLNADRLDGLETSAGPVDTDRAVLAVPAPVAGGLLPGLVTPDVFEAILNLHFRAEPAGIPADVARAGFCGMIGGIGEWVFIKPGHVSVTISAANRIVDMDTDMLAAKVWPEASAALGIPAAARPAWRVVKERRATFAATNAQEVLRPGSTTRVGNLTLAGDWTSTGLPATIEGAIRSGLTAAEQIRARP